MNDVYSEVKEGIEKGKSLNEIKESLTGKGAPESAIIDAISQYKSKEGFAEGKDTKKIFTKEILDKVSHGFTSLQFVNMLFFLTGASYFIIGLINGAKVILSSITNHFLQNYPVKYISKNIIGLTGIFFGLSFFFVAVAKYYNSVPLFIFAVLLMGICAAVYGGYYRTISLTIKKGGSIMNKIAKYGLIITALSILFAGFMIDNFNQGYFIIFTVAAIFFIASGTILFSMQGKTPVRPEKNFLATIKTAFSFNLLGAPLKILKNKTVLILIIAGSITSLVQTIGNSYYGIFIYNEFRNVGFGGFSNVAMVFLIAVFSSLVGEIVTRINVREYGKLPLLVFGTLLLAIMPLSYYYRPTLVTITMGTMFGVIGGAVIGFAQGLSTLDINKDERKSYFYVSNVSAFFGYLIFVPVLAALAQNYGLQILFLLLTIILVLMMPFYLVIILQKRSS